MSRFLVLEGDNGSGKSTVAALLGAAGLHIISNDPELKNVETQAKKLCGRERMRAFYAYNRQAARYACSYGTECVVVRYWPSTLAAAYADGVIGDDEFAQQCLENIKAFPEPAVFVYLKCDHSERSRRIAARDAPGASDDCSLFRARKYQYAIGHMALAGPTPWTFLASDAMQPQCLARCILGLLDGFTSAPPTQPQC